MKFQSLLGQYFTSAGRLAIHMVFLVFGALLQEFSVELLYRAYTRQRNTDIPSDIAHKVLYQD